MLRLAPAPRDLPTEPKMPRNDQAGALLPDVFVFLGLTALGYLHGTSAVRVK
jgi:hypothetical protein